MNINKAWVIKVDSLGCDNLSCFITTSINATGFEIDNLIKIYPNPNNGNMTFEYELSEFEKGQLSIYDVAGRKIVDYELSTGNKIVTVSETILSSGIYFYIYKVNDVVQKNEKIVIIK